MCLIRSLFYLLPPVVKAMGLMMSSAIAREKGGGDLRSAVQNPISSLISLPSKFTLDFDASNGDAQILNVNPVVPITVGEWNLVNRALVPIGSVDGPIAGLPGNPSPIPGDGASGLGDINYSLYFSPVKVGKLIWACSPASCGRLPAPTTAPT